MTYWYKWPRCLRGHIASWPYLDPLFDVSHALEISCSGGVPFKLDPSDSSQARSLRLLSLKLCLGKRECIVRRIYRTPTSGETWRVTDNSHVSMFSIGYERGWVCQTSVLDGMIDDGLPD